MQTLQLLPYSETFDMIIKRLKRIRCRKVQAGGVADALSAFGGNAVGYAVERQNCYWMVRK
jgi:hypothetical protein